MVSQKIHSTIFANIDDQHLTNLKSSRDSELSKADLTTCSKT